VLGIEPYQSIVLGDGEGDGVLSFHFAQLNRPREEDVAGMPRLRREGVLAAKILVAAQVHGQPSGDSWALLLLCLGLVEVQGPSTVLSKAGLACGSLPRLDRERHRRGAALGFESLPQLHDVLALGDISKVVARRVLVGIVSGLWGSHKRRLLDSCPLFPLLAAPRLGRDDKDGLDRETGPVEGIGVIDGDQEINRTGSFDSELLFEEFLLESRREHLVSRVGRCNDRRRPRLTYGGGADAV